MKRLIPDYITKIEGHGVLKVNFEKPWAVLNVTEGERLFEGLVVGRNFADGPWLTSRICGICPMAHNLASIKAIEKALDVEPSPATNHLRKLMAAAQIIQSHNLHLFYLALPDFVNVKDSLKLAEKYPSQFRTILTIKKVSDLILKIVAGRSIHPISNVIGGFSHKISHSKLSNLRFEIEKTFDEAEDYARLFSSLQYPKLTVKAENLAITSDAEYGFYDGIILSNSGSAFLSQRYQKEIEEQIKMGSTAKFGYRKERELIVGALSRLNLNSQKLNLRAKKILTESKIKFPSQNPFHNNFAQSLEILHFLEEAVKIIDSLQKSSLDTTPEPIKVRAGEGVGAVEAPRGTLYHHYKISADGKINYLNIITPTVQNLSSLEKAVRLLLKKNKNSKCSKIKKLIEMLIRAYDPCLTCSVH